MGITIEKNVEKTSLIRDVVVGGTFKYNETYYIKIEYEDEEDEISTIIIDLSTGQENGNINNHTPVMSVNLVMREKTDE